MIGKTISHYKIFEKLGDNASARDADGKCCGYCGGVYRTGIICVGHGA